MPPDDDTFAYATARDLGQRLRAGELSAAGLTEGCLGRTAALDVDGPRLRSVLAVNPEALHDARRLDDERVAGGVRGPLHGIPILLKDNVDTRAPLETTAGSLALTGSCAPRDSTIAERLRAAGCVILGKANLSEWANYRGRRSSSGWSAVGGQTRNPHVLDRNPGGSSAGSGAAVAAGLSPLAIGSETDGSIYGPASFCGIVGFKPTVGLLSRAGVIPISASQDTLGPMTRTVFDAALVLDAVAGPDARDPATEANGPPGWRGRGAVLTPPAGGFAAALDDGDLRGLRLGVARRFAGFHEAVDAHFETALTCLREAGAELIDSADLPSHDLGESETVVLQTELKDGLARYLATRPDAGPRTLADLIAFNVAHADRELRWFGQERFEESERRGGLDSAEYVEALARCRRLSRDEGIDAAATGFGVDAFVAPSLGPATLIDLVLGRAGGLGGCGSMSAVAGYPHLTVPMGLVHDLPVGLSVMGTAGADATVLRIGHAFQRAIGPPPRPRFLATTASPDQGSSEKGG
jgi:amidase